MPAITPDEGLVWWTRRAIGEDGAGEIHYVAVGTGLENPTSESSELNNEVYRTNVNNNNCSVERVDDTDMIEVSVSISGGTELDPGTQISEVGVFTENDVMVYYEVRDTIEVSSGERNTLQFQISKMDV